MNDRLKEFEHMWTTDIAQYRLLVIGDQDPTKDGLLVRRDPHNPDNESTLLIEEDDLGLALIRRLYEAGVQVERLEPKQ